LGELVRVGLNDPRAIVVVKLVKIGGGDNGGSESTAKGDSVRVMHDACSGLYMTDVRVM
jgi:hypothetical protein